MYSFLLSYAIQVSKKKKEKYCIPRQALKTRQQKTRFIFNSTRIRSWEFRNKTIVYIIPIASVRGRLRRLCINAELAWEFIQGFVKAADCDLSRTVRLQKCLLEALGLLTTIYL